MTGVEIPPMTQMRPSVSRTDVGYLLSRAFSDRTIAPLSDSSSHRRLNVMRFMQSIVSVMKMDGITRLSVDAIEELGLWMRTVQALLFQAGWFVKHAGLSHRSYG